MKRLGFTGTQLGMTPEQSLAVETLLFVYVAEYDWLHHGDCIGADADANRIARFVGYSTKAHPPTVTAKRAYCEVDQTAQPKYYLTRNHDIVNETVMLIATPRQSDEVMRSGTWATIRYAVKRSKPVIIVAPDGTLEGR